MLLTGPSSFTGWSPHKSSGDQHHSKPLPLAMTTGTNYSGIATYAEIPPWPKPHNRSAGRSASYAVGANNSVLSRRPIKTQRSSKRQRSLLFHQTAATGSSSQSYTKSASCGVGQPRMSQTAPGRWFPGSGYKWTGGDPSRRKPMCAIALLLIIGIIVGGFMLGRAERSWAEDRT